MRRMFVYAALLAVAGIAPAHAERLYVPVIGAHAADGRALGTQVWVTNVSKGTRSVSAKFLGAGDARSFAVERGGRMLDELAKADAVGLIAVDADEKSVSAWIGDGIEGNLNQVPVFAWHDSYHAGASPILNEFPAKYDRLMIGAANLEAKGASCSAKLFASDGRELGNIPFEVAAQSLAREDAGAWTSSRPAWAQVTCNKQFFPIGVTTSPEGTNLSWVKGIGPNGPCNFFKALDKTGDGGDGFDMDGIFHQPTPAHPKAIVCLTLPASKAQARYAKIVYEWDVTGGPWYPKKPNGIHNLMYAFTNRYRSGVIGNVNALGVGKYALKIMQNYGMPIHSNTNASAGFQVQKGVLYHAKYVFDANGKAATLFWYNSNGGLLKTITAKAQPGNGQAIVLTPYGGNGLAAVSEFGNYASFGAIPEVPTFGWVYANFRVRATPK